MRPNSRLKNVLIESNGQVCQGYEEKSICQKRIDQSDIDIILDLQDEYPLYQSCLNLRDFKPICHECYIEFFETRDFQGDFNLFRPEETAQDFEEHEDD